MPLRMLAMLELAVFAHPNPSRLATAVAALAFNFSGAVGRVQPE
jgi:hypothetical protein